MALPELSTTSDGQGGQQWSGKRANEEDEEEDGPRRLRARRGGREECIRSIVARNGTLSRDLAMCKQVMLDSRWMSLCTDGDSADAMVADVSDREAARTYTRVFPRPHFPRTICTTNR